jgi:RimJ/RimL family protein N-acetyltransferase
VSTADSFVLRPWAADDAAWYIAARDDEILRWTTEPSALSAAEFEAGLQSLDERQRAGFAIAFTAGGPAGNVAAVRNGTVAEISYWVAAEARGRGAATFALVTMSEWVAANWPVDRLELLINPENLASFVVAERAGYTFAEVRETCLSCAGPDGTVSVFAREAGSAVC